jgi:hypothetical protein
LRQKGIQDGAPHVLVSNPSSQKVTSSGAFSSGAGNNDNTNIYDGTGNAGTDKYSKQNSVSFNTVFDSQISCRLLLWWLGELSSKVSMDRI